MDGVVFMYVCTAEHYRNYNIELEAALLYYVVVLTL